MMRIILLVVVLWGSMAPPVSAQYVFLPAQYPEYQSLLNPALLPLENPYYFDDVQVGLHQRYSNERWHPSLGKNRQSLLFLGLDLEDYAGENTRLYELAGHLNIYREENSPYITDAIYAGTRIHLWLWRSAVPDQGLSLYAGLGYGLIQHKVNYEQLPTDFPSDFTVNEAFFKFRGSANLGASLSYKTTKFEAIGSFSLPASFGFDQLVSVSTDWYGNILYTGLSLRYYRNVGMFSYHPLSYLELQLNTGLDGGALIYPNIGINWGFHGTYIVGAGYALSRESQAVAKNNPQGSAFLHLSMNLPLLSINGNPLSTHLSYRFVTDADSFSGQRTHSLGMALCLTELLIGKNVESYWRGRGL